eukprot:COSAG02_NODE_898_length_16108_cov_5.877444_1_plen_99_part_00
MSRARACDRAWDPHAPRQLHTSTRCSGDRSRVLASDLRLVPISSLRREGEKEPPSYSCTLHVPRYSSCPMVRHSSTDYRTIEYNRISSTDYRTIQYTY